jgi:hypothetical protein
MHYLLELFSEPRTRRRADCRASHASNSGFDLCYPLAREGEIFPSKCVHQTIHGLRGIHLHAESFSM